MISQQFNPMKKVFKDERLQKQIEKDGYVVVPFYTEEEVKRLHNIFYSLHEDNEIKGFFSTTFSLNKNYREGANEAILEIGKPPIDNLFTDYKIWSGSFLVKANDENSALSVHQDMTLMDESKFTGLNIWCPLIDLNENNGPLMVLPGSHRITPTLRGSTIPGIYENTHELILEMMQTLYVKKGQAVIFDQSIIHASPPNRSNELRIVTNTFITHKDAKIMTCYFDQQRNEIEIFEQKDDFMTNYINFGHDIHSRPKIGRSLGFTKYDFPKLSKEQLYDLYGTPKKVNPILQKKNIFKRIFGKNLMDKK